MATTKTYGDGCGIARALDVVGPRWAIPVIRELLFGPLRFSDLERALPGASTTILTDRLRELADHGVVVRRRLPPPAAATVYQLTDRGRALEPILLDLGAWGLEVPRPEPAVLSPSSVLLFLRGRARPRANAARLVVRLVLQARVFAVTVAGGSVVVEAGEPDGWDASIECDPMTLYEILSGERSLAGAQREGLATVADDRMKLRLLVDAVRA